jgi:hypothetical protein
LYSLLWFKMLGLGSALRNGSALIVATSFFFAIKRRGDFIGWRNGRRLGGAFASTQTSDEGDSDQSFHGVSPLRLSGTDNVGIGVSGNSKPSRHGICHAALPPRLLVLTSRN